MPGDIAGAPTFPEFQTVTFSTFHVFIQHKQFANLTRDSPPLKIQSNPVYFFSRCRIPVHTAPDQRQSDERLEHADDQQTAARMRAPGQLYRAIHSLSPAIYHITWWLTCRHLSYWSSW